MKRATRPRTKPHPSPAAAVQPGSWLHEPFLERAAEPGLVDSGQAALAAFLTLRLVDRFAVGVAESSEQALAYQTQATRDYLLELPTPSPEVGHLTEIVRVADAVRAGSHRRVLWPTLQAYAYWLEQELRLAEALDVVETGLRLTDGDAVREETAANLQRGRILRLLGRFDEASTAYGVARARALTKGDMHSALLARIGEAIVMRNVGNLSGSEDALREILRDAEEAADGDAQARSHHDLGTVLIHRERGKEAIKHLFRAFELYEQSEYKLRALSDVGEALKRQGHYAASKDALMLVLKRGPSTQTRATNMIQLLELSALTGDRLGFARWARDLASVADELPPERRADFELLLGRGHSIFGQTGKARVALERALTITEQHGLHEGAFRARQELEALEKSTAQGLDEDPRPPQAESSAEILEVAEKLQALHAG